MPRYVVLQELCCVAPCSELRDSVCALSRGPGISLVKVETSSEQTWHESVVSRRVHRAGTRSQPGPGSLPARRVVGITAILTSTGRATGRHMLLRYARARAHGR